MQAILPYLFVLACPVGMGLMLFFMMRMMRQPQQTNQRPLNTSEEGSSLDAPPLGGRTRAEQVAELQARLEEIHAQHERLARELARQEHAERHHLAETESRG